MLLGKNSNYTNTSYIGKKSHFRGNFFSKTSLNVYGKFEGENIDVDQLIISINGKIKSDISCTNIDVEGLIIGNISASNRIFLRPKSQVLGNIQTKELIIQNGVILEGKCIIGKKFDKSKEEFNRIFYGHEDE